MRWEDERYVRLYTRDTTTWKMLPWQGKCLVGIVMRKLDRAGVLDLGDDGMEVLAVLTDMPLDMVEIGMAALMKRGVFALAGTKLVMPNFLSAQETSQSDKARKAAQRERYRSQTMSGEVTERDEQSRNVTPESRNVTESHAPSQPVTGGHAASQAVTPCLAVPSRTEVSPPPPVGGETDSLPGIPANDPKPRRARREAQPMPWTIGQMCDVLRDEGGGRFIVDPFDSQLAKPLTMVIRSLGDAGVTLDDIARAARWVRDGGAAWAVDGFDLRWVCGRGNLSGLIGKAFAKGSP